MLILGEQEAGIEYREGERIYKATRKNSRNMLLLLLYSRTNCGDISRELRGANRNALNRVLSAGGSIAFV